MMKLTRYLFIKYMGFMALTVLLVATFFVTLATHNNKDKSNASAFISWAVYNHITIMLVLIVISVAFGFLLSNISHKELKQTKRTSKSLLETIFLFLNNDEKEIINLLVEKKGATTQAEISRLPGMNRVKAYRSLRKLEENDLVQVTPHGKLRKVKLNEKILSLLMSG